MITLVKERFDLTWGCMAEVSQLSWQPGWLSIVQTVNVLTEATCSGKGPGRRDFGCDVVATCPLM